VSAAASPAKDGPTVERNPWSEKDIQKLVSGAQRLKDRAVAYFEKIPGEQGKKKTIACSGAITTKSGWGSGDQPASPVTDEEKEQANLYARQRFASRELLWEQGKEQERRGQFPRMLTRKGATAPDPIQHSDDIDWDRTFGGPEPHQGPLPAPTRGRASDYQRPEAPQPGEGHQARGAGAFDFGIPGQYALSHAEKQAFVLTGMPAVGVSRAMCDDCQSYFLEKARASSKLLAVADPGMTRIFLPDGTMMRR
jgi:hypothetical protein